MKIVFFLELNYKMAIKTMNYLVHFAIFIKTHKRQPNKTYNESFDYTSNKIVRILVHLYTFRI